MHRKILRRGCVSPVSRADRLVSFLFRADIDLVRERVMGIRGRIGVPLSTESARPTEEKIGLEDNERRRG